MDLNPRTPCAVPHCRNIPSCCFPLVQGTLRSFPQQGRSGVPFTATSSCKSGSSRVRGVELKLLRQKRSKVCSSVFHLSDLPPNSFAMKRMNWREVNTTSYSGLMCSGSDLAGFDGICFENSEWSSLRGKSLTAAALCSKYCFRSWGKKAKAIETPLQSVAAGSMY